MISTCRLEVVKAAFFKIVLRVTLQNQCIVDEPRYMLKRNSSWVRSRMNKLAIIINGINIVGKVMLVNIIYYYYYRAC